MHSEPSNQFGEVNRRSATKGDHKIGIAVSIRFNAALNILQFRIHFKLRQSRRCPLAEQRFKNHVRAGRRVGCFVEDHKGAFDSQRLQHRANFAERLDQGLLGGGQDDAPKKFDGFCWGDFGLIS